jgi:hypothetical protein
MPPTNPHPNYPDIEFKPSLALFDYDQTYDMAYVGRVSPLIIRDLPSLTEGQGVNIFDYLYNDNVVLTDRYFAEDFPFAVDYSAKLYYSLSPYANTGYEANTTAWAPNGTSINFSSNSIETQHYNYINGLAWYEQVLPANDARRETYSKALSENKDYFVFDDYIYRMEEEVKPNGDKVYYLTVEIAPHDLPLYLIYGIVDETDAGVGKGWKGVITIGWKKQVVAPSTERKVIKIKCPDTYQIIQPFSLTAFYKRPVPNAGKTDYVYDTADDVLTAIETVYGKGITYRNLDGFLYILTTWFDYYYPFRRNKRYDYYQLR